MFQNKPEGVSKLSAHIKPNPTFECWLTYTLVQAPEGGGWPSTLDVWQESRAFQDM